MKARSDFDIELLNSIFDYNRDTGDIKWRHSGGSGRVGSVAGSKKDGRPIRITFRGRDYSAHRIAWAIHYNEQPPEVIDHIDGNNHNNAILNLRDGTGGINQQNQKKAHKRNVSSKYLGVSLLRGRWRAKIYHNKTYYFLGYFNTEEEARDAYIEAKRKLHEGCEL